MKILKRIVGVAILLFIILGVVLFQKYVTKTVFQADDVNGNTSGNIMNGGLFCELGNKIYFSNPDDDGMLYVMNQDMKQIKKLSNDKVAYINAAGKYIIYSRVNNTKSGSNGDFFIMNSIGIYRISTNGSNLKLLDKNPCGIMNVYGNYIYYQNFTKKDEIDLYRLKIDGTNSEKLNDEAFSPTTIQDNKMYYTGILSDHNIHVMNLYDKSSSLLFQGNCFNPITNGDYIYYISLADNYSIARMKMDGSGSTILVKDRCSTFHVSNDGTYVYYQIDDSTNNGLYRMDLETQNATLIKPGNYNHIHVTGRYVFFQEFDTGKTYYLSSGEDPTVNDFITK